VDVFERWLFYSKREIFRAPGHARGGVGFHAAGFVDGNMIRRNPRQAAEFRDEPRVIQRIAQMQDMMPGFDVSLRRICRRPCESSLSSF
jgi:hypothetical protein